MSRNQLEYHASSGKSKQRNLPQTPALAVGASVNAHKMDLQTSFLVSDFLSNITVHPCLSVVKKFLIVLRGMLLLVFVLSSGCTSPTPISTQAPLDLASVFPATDAIPGWDISQKAETYNHDNLFNLVNGQAESFFAYGFKQVAVQRYQDALGSLLNVEIWQLATPADAYGLFSTARAGGPAAIGNEADSDPGRRLAFWQERCFVSLNALQPVPDETLRAFAQAISSKLPAGGEPPGIVNRLPQSGLVERSAIFFHEEMSIQMEVWLGGGNILGLSQATNGVVGRYQLGDGNVRMMLVEYPTTGQAATGLQALQEGNLSNLAASDTQGKLLGAVFGKLDAAQAKSLLQEALK